MPTPVRSVSFRPSAVFAAGCLSALFANPAVGQIPDGHLAVAARPAQMPGGIWIFDPREPGPGLAISGLEPDLTTAGGGGGGANALLVRDDDGALVVGEWGRNGASLDVHVITLSGSRVVVDRRISLGVGAPLGAAPAVADMDWLPNGDVVVATRNLPPSALGGTPLAIVSLTTGVVTPIPLNPPPSLLVGSVVYDAASASVLYGTVIGSGPAIYRVALTGGTPQQVYPLVAEDMVLHPDGSLYVAAGSIVRVEQPSGAWRVVVPNLQTFHLTVERATGALQFTSASGVHWAPSSGGVRNLASLSGVTPTDIALRSDPRVYGVPSPAAKTVRWQPALNGVPRLGTTMHLEVAVSPAGGAAGVVLAALAPAAIPVLGGTLLLDPATVVPLTTMPAAGRVALPIPQAPALVARSVYLQSIHPDPAGVAASDGLALTFLR